MGTLTTKSARSGLQNLPLDRAPGSSVLPMVSRCRYSTNVSERPSKTSWNGMLEQVSLWWLTSCRYVASCHRLSMRELLPTGGFRCHLAPSQHYAYGVTMRLRSNSLITPVTFRSGILEKGWVDQAAAALPRNVRASQSKVVGNTHPGKPARKCNRK